MSASTTIPRVVKSGFVSFYRNGWLSVAATGIVMLTLLLISIFVLLLLLGNQVVKNIQSKIDVEVYFKDTTKVDDITTLKSQLEAQPNTQTVRYISKQEAFSIYKGQSEQNRKLVENIPEEENPLPASLQIKAKDTTNLEAFNPVLESDFAKPLVESRSDQNNRDIIKRLQRIVSFIRSLGLFISSVVLIFSILVVFNTIRITIFSRRREIEIMKLVGASNWYIRGPFIIEGIFYGVIATIFALLMVYILVLLFGGSVSSFVGDNQIDVKSYFIDNLPIFILLQLSIGVLVGVLSSVIAIRRHLRS